MSTAHILYAAVFRLAIIAAGFGCVVMGYRLFVLGVMPKDGSQIDAQAGEIRLSLKNAAPGTCFAILGVFMIISMLLQGLPETTVKETPTKSGVQRSVTWRSGDQGVSVAVAQGSDLENSRQFNEAIKAYAKPLGNDQLSLKTAILLLNKIAKVYYKQGRIDEAMAYASLACQVEPENAQNLAFLSDIYLRKGEVKTAIDALSKAAMIDPAYNADLDRMKGKIP